VTIYRVPAARKFTDPPWPDAEKQFVLHAEPIPPREAN